MKCNEVVQSKVRYEYLRASEHVTSTRGRRPHPGFTALHTLNLSVNALGKEGAEALGASPRGIKRCIYITF